MNRELFAVLPGTPMDASRELLRVFGIGAVPVLDDGGRPLGIVTAGAPLDGDGTAHDRMTGPASCIEEAARLLVPSDAHHLGRRVLTRGG